MSDLIDRQALMESIGVADDCEKCQYNDTIHKGFCTMPSEFVNVCEAIADAPSAEPRKGKWVDIVEMDSGGYPFKVGVCCSACGFETVSEDNYCPHCGAKMMEVTE